MGHVAIEHHAGSGGGIKGPLHFDSAVADGNVATLAHHQRMAIVARSRTRHNGYVVEHKVGNAVDREHIVRRLAGSPHERHILAGTHKADGVRRRRTLHIVELHLLLVGAVRYEKSDRTFDTHCVHGVDSLAEGTVVGTLGSYGVVATAETHNEGAADSVVAGYGIAFHRNNGHHRMTARSHRTSEKIHRAELSRGKRLVNLGSGFWQGIKIVVHRSAVLHRGALVAKVHMKGHRITAVVDDSLLSGRPHHRHILGGNVDHLEVEGGVGSRTTETDTVEADIRALVVLSRRTYIFVKRGRGLCGSVLVQHRLALGGVTSLHSRGETSLAAASDLYHHTRLSVPLEGGVELVGYPRTLAPTQHKGCALVDQPRALPRVVRGEDGIAGLPHGYLISVVGKGILNIKRVEVEGDGCYGTRRSSGVPQVGSGIDVLILDKFVFGLVGTRVSGLCIGRGSLAHLCHKRVGNDVSHCHCATCIKNFRDIHIARIHGIHLVVIPDGSEPSTGIVREDSAGGIVHLLGRYGGGSGRSVPCLRAGPVRIVGTHSVIRHCIDPHAHGHHTVALERHVQPLIEGVGNLSVGRDAAVNGLRHCIGTCRIVDHRVHHSGDAVVAYRHTDLLHSHSARRLGQHRRQHLKFGSRGIVHQHHSFRQSALTAIVHIAYPFRFGG